MSLAEELRVARESGDWRRLVAAVPFCALLKLRMEVMGERLICVLPGHAGLTGNPWLPAMHGGATAGFMECAAILFLLWHRDSAEMPKSIDFNMDFLRSGKLVDTYAEMQMVKLGARVANVRVTAWQSEPDKPIAIGHGNFLLSS